VTIGEYASSWTQRHPRSERTNATNAGRIAQVLDLELEGRPLRDWPFRDLRRRHAVDLVDVMLREQGRAHSGAQNILRSLSVMAENAIDDEIAEVNFVAGVRVKANDPRVRGETKPPRVFSLEELHRFAAQGGAYELMLRVFTDCGLRLGEVLGLARTDFDGEVLQLRGSAHAGVFTAGDQPTKRHVRAVPVPVSTAEMIRSMPTRMDTEILFPTPTGRIWHESNFRRDVWTPAVAAYLGFAPRDGETTRAPRVLGTTAPRQNLADSHSVKPLGTDGVGHALSCLASGFRAKAAAGRARPAMPR
jgi:integrase